MPGHPSRSKFSQQTLASVIKLAALLAVVSLALCAAPTAWSQTRSGWPGFITALDEYVAADGVIGASAVLLRDGRVAARHNVGLAVLGAQVPVTDRTIFHWGSITKTLTGIAAMQLRDRGLLSLDDTVVHYLPELRRVHNPYGSMAAVTVRMLLSHTAGFMAPTWPYDRGRDWEPFEPSEWSQLVAMMPYQSLRFPPGSRYGYSNPAFIYVARIIEQLTGDPWAVYVQKNIWSPLAMRRSYVGATPYHLLPDRSYGYTIRRDSTGAEEITTRGPDFDPGVTIPNGGWNAPLDDLARYAAFLTGAVEGDGERELFAGVLSRSSLEEMWSPVAPLSPGGDGSEAVGLAFHLYQVAGRLVVGHTGDQGGFRAMFYFDPSTGTALVAVLNTSNYIRAESDPEWEVLVARARRAVLVEGERQSD